MTSLLSRRLSPVRSILLFGASGHISGPAAAFIQAEAPHVRLRLATSRIEQVAPLRERFAGAEVVQASYLDLDSLVRAIDGFDTMLIITPDFLDERRAMVNVVAAANRGEPRHIVRLTGDPPHIHRLEQVAAELTAWENGVAANHLRARAVLEASGAPVTFLNVASYYMDNFSRSLGGPVIASRTLRMPYERHMTYIDPRDVGIAAARLLLSDDSFHVGKTYHLDNGADHLTFAEVAALMSDVFGEAIAYDDSVEGFRTECGPMIEAHYPGMLEYMLAYFRWEQRADTVWRRTDVLATMFGIKGRTLRAWFEENREFFSAGFGQTAREIGVDAIRS